MYGILKGQGGAPLLDSQYNVSVRSSSQQCCMFRRGEQQCKVYDGIITLYVAVGHTDLLSDWYLYSLLSAQACMHPAAVNVCGALLCLLPPWGVRTTNKHSTPRKLR